jgi:hypothetical protein
METSRRDRRSAPRWLKAAGIGVAVGMLILLTMIAISRHQLRTQPHLATYSGLQQYVRGAALSTRYSDVDFRALVDFLTTLTPQQLDKMREREGLPFSALDSWQQGMLTGLAVRYPGFFGGVDLQQSYIKTYLSPAKEQFEWYVKRGGQDDRWSMGLRCVPATTS